MPADRGNSTVIMDRTEYRSKVRNILDDVAYRPLKKDPTCKLERTINERLKGVVKKGEMNEKLRKRLELPPQLYGLPKIHKTDIPLRPIGSATYLLAREVARILTPLKGKCSSYIRNSSHFVEKI